MSEPTGLPVVILGPGADSHVQAMQVRLGRLGVPVRLLDLVRFPDEMALTLGESMTAIEVDGQPLRPAAVYVRNLGLSALDLASATDADELRQAIAVNRERSDLCASLVHRWEEAGIPVYNGLRARNRITKPFQLALLHGAGLPVPRTIFTSDPEAVRRFARSCAAAGHGVAYKPIAGGAATRALTVDDLTPERLDSLSASPVTFQELLPGDEIRVYVLDGEIVAMIRIVSSALDYRQHEEACEPVVLPAAVQRQCLLAAETIGLRFTGMDLKRDALGTLRFLELNPSPMFLGFDQRAETSIASHLASRLATWHLGSR
jgi:glutathione synthase/RimK-type ligase-like ATP-grasp enzyme